MQNLIVVLLVGVLASCSDADSSSYDCELYAQTLIDCVDGETQEEFAEKVQVCEMIKTQDPQLVDCLEAAGSECSAFLACTE